MNARENQREPLSSRQTLPMRSRLIVGFAALGGFAVLVSGELFLPFALSQYAIQNDVYMSNLFLGPVFAFIGVVGLFIGGLLSLRQSGAYRLGRLWLRALALAVVGAGVVAIAALLFGGHYESYPPGAVFWPPYLNEALLAFALVVALLVFLGGLVWDDSGRPNLRAGHA